MEEARLRAVPWIVVELWWRRKCVRCSRQPRA